MTKSMSIVGRMQRQEYVNGGTVMFCVIAALNFDAPPVALNKLLGNK